MAGEADAEEEEDFFDFGELIAEVSVDDQEGEDVDAVDQDDESIQQGHRHEGLLQGTDALPLYHRCQVGVDSRELHREDASVPEVFSQVVGDVVVLAVVVQRQPHLEGVYYREVGHCPGAVAKGVVVALVEHRAGVLKVDGGDESVQLRRKEQVVHVMLQLAQTVSDGVQLWLVQHSFVLDFVDKFAAAGVDRSHVFSLAEDRLEVADLARKDRGEDKQANDVDYEANNSDSSNRVDDLSTQHRFLRILPLLEFASTR